MVVVARTCLSFQCATYRSAELGHSTRSLVVPTWTQGIMVGLPLQRGTAWYPHLRRRKGYWEALADGLVMPLKGSEEFSNHSKSAQKHSSEARQNPACGTISPLRVARTGSEDWVARLEKGDGDQ